MSSSNEMERLHDDIDEMDELIHHPWLQFPQGTIARNRRDRLLRKEMGQQKTIDYDLLAELGQLERMTTIIGEDTPWSRLFEMTFAPQYRLITMEFLSTFVFTPRAADQAQADQQQPEVSFRLCGLAYTMYLAEFGNALGLYTEEELQMPIYTSAIHTADDAVVSAWWPRIGDEPFAELPGYGACRYAGLCTGSFRQTDRAGHACRAEVPRGGASIFPAEGGHLGARPK
ncbi:hypothetical protein R6Q57_020923 [Mikania cordata]